MINPSQLSKYALSAFAFLKLQYFRCRIDFNNHINEFDDFSDVGKLPQTDVTDSKATVIYMNAEKKKQTKILKRKKRLPFIQRR